MKFIKWLKSLFKKKKKTSQIRVKLHHGQVSQIVEIIARHHFSQQFRGDRAGRRRTWAKFYKSFRQNFYAQPLAIQDNILAENRELFTHG